ncbi:hypothetical protein CP97_05190 [Aurantiacibacter atlanticus]|uniref:Uncharacterized protein n=2 Tax=Erythrobacteraceae TaxID=335929 RepID=A0A0H4VFD0_9SPHN|nr:hypothetical protein [Aurantiacibacter atlanticus]AKQ41546.1 hypothetical protein CP97_05190 [Aurantiacibacter atlanticus]
MHQITGPAAETLIQQQIAAHSGGIAQALAPFRAQSSVYAWLDTIRAIEEFINLPLFGLEDDALEQAIVTFRLDDLDPTALASIRSALIDQFGERLAERFLLTVIQASAIGAAFRAHGLFEVASGFQTIAHAIGYFQSRRRHLVAMLYAMPLACRGSREMGRIDTLNFILPLVEHSGATITGLHQKQMLARIFPDFALNVSANGFTANYEYELLESMFLEPERAGILDVQPGMDGAQIMATLEPVDPRLIFSAAELRNDIRLMEAAYAEFALMETDFGPMAHFVQACLACCEDDYLIKLPADRLTELADEAELPGALRRHLEHHDADYVACTNAIAPFIRLDGAHISTVTLLSRFLYYWKTACLNRQRRFQIRSGFIFEDNVNAALAKQGFAVTDVKRINRKEFDVVATLDQVIYNVQCKNNLIDINRIETDPVRFARYNCRLDRYYGKALAKEEAREHLLKERLGLSKVRHFLLSRFPVVTLNPRVIPFRRIDEFRTLIAEDPPI